MAGVQQGRAYDWPLSREEKKSRVLELYETEAQVTNQILFCGDGSKDVGSPQHAAPFDAAVGMRYTPERPSPKDEIRGSDCSPPHADATNTESRRLNAFSEDVVQDCGRGRPRRNTDYVARPERNSKANSHTRSRRRRHHSAACRLPPKEDSTQSVGSKGEPFLLEGTNASGRKDDTACPPPKPSSSGKPAKNRGRQGHISGQTSPPRPGHKQHIVAATHAWKGNVAPGSHGGNYHYWEPIGARRSTQSKHQCRASNCEAEHQKMTHAGLRSPPKAKPLAVGAAPVKHDLQQDSWRPSMKCVGGRCSSAQEGTMTHQALSQQSVEGLPHASWRPSLLPERTPTAAATTFVAKPYRGGMDRAQVGVHGVH